MDGIKEFGELDEASDIDDLDESGDIDNFDASGLKYNARLDQEQEQERQLAVVESILLERSFVSRRGELGGVATLVRLVHDAAEGDPQAINSIVELAIQFNNFRGLDADSLYTFKSLRQNYTWLNMEMEAVSATLFVDDPLIHWTVNEAFHNLYERPLPIIYCSIVQTFSRPQFDNSTVLLDYMEWCITPDVATTFSNPRNWMTNLAIRTWWDIASGRNHPISGLLTFGATVKLLGFNMYRESGPQKIQVSLWTILTKRDDKYIDADPFVAHVLYPSVFPPYPPLIAPYDIVLAISLALQGHATLEQISQICPYSPEKRILMADIVRMSLRRGRPDIAMAYGLGPGILDIIYTSNPKRVWEGSSYNNWTMYSFLRSISKHVALDQVVEIITSGSTNRQHVERAKVDYNIFLADHQ